MTKRVCFIGNSHLIMVQQAWMARDEKQKKGIEATFFASLLKHYADLAVKDGKLVAGEGMLATSFTNSSNGSSVIDPADYDLFVVVGMRVAMIQFYRLTRSFALTGESGITNDAAYLMSEPLFRDWAIESFDSSEGFDFVRSLKLVTEKPVILVPQPHPANKILTNGRGEHLPEMGASFYSLFDRVFDEAVSALGEKYDLTVWKQPDDMKQAPGMTKSSFLDGAVSLTGKSFPENDEGHMNAKFGERILADVLS